MVMSLHSGIDTIAFVSGGIYTETYGLGEEVNVANLFGFYGLLEDVPIGEAITPGRKRVKMELGYLY